MQIGTRMAPGGTVMIYQVLVRSAAGATWEPYQDATTDPFAAMRLVQMAGRAHREVTVVQAATLNALDGLLRRIHRGEEPARVEFAVPCVTSAHTVSVVSESFEERYWDIELGPAGDRDVPYRFEFPANMGVLAKWLALFARHHAPRPTGEDDTAAA